MLYVALGIAAFVTVWFGMHALADASQRALRRVVLILATMLGGAVAGFLLLSGRIWLGMIVLGAVLGLHFPGTRLNPFGRGSRFSGGPFQRGSRDSGGSHSARGNKNRGGKHKTRASNPDNLSTEEAREILGVSAAATPSEIERSYRALMKKLHPDLGGTDWFAKRLTAARDRLLAK